VSIVSCTNCHFETLLAIKKNRAMKKIKNFELLVKRNGKVTTGSFMTHTYNGMSNYIIAPFRSHIITRNAKTCTDCHVNLGGSVPAILEYNATGHITMARWDSVQRTIVTPTGVVPIPSDWRTSLKFDYATYTGRVDTIWTDPTRWVYLKSTSDNGHLYYAQPLDSATLAKLGFTRFPTAVDVRQTLPEKYALYQNYPNPFNPATTIRYELPRSSHVQLRLYDVMGREVATLVSGVQEAGSHEYRLTAEQLSSGVYLYRLQAEGFTQTRKLLLLR
jgi:hypothetical protein